jgi:hypothetical protein
MAVNEQATTIESKGAPSKKVNRMWGFDLDTWNSLVLWSLGATAVAAFAIAISTRAVIVLQKEAEIQTKQEFERYKLEASKEIAASEAHTKDSEARTKEAELKIEQLRLQIGDRQIDQTKFVKSLEGATSSWPVEIVFPKGNREAYLLARSIYNGLHAADWPVSEPTPIEPDKMFELIDDPMLVAAGGAPPPGLFLVLNLQDETTAFGVKRLHPPVPWSALPRAIVKSFIGGIVSISLVGSTASPPPPRTLRLVIGPKP